VSQCYEDIDQHRGGTTAPVPLRLSRPKWWDWPAILCGILKDNAVGTILALIGLALGLMGLAITLIGPGSPTTLSSLIQGEPNSPDTRVMGDASVSSAKSVACSPALVQRLTLVGDQTSELIVKHSSQASGSGGVAIACDALEPQTLVFKIDFKILSGDWTLRIDDGSSEPLYMGIVGGRTVRVTGSNRYRFLIYSDDLCASASINDLTIKLADRDDRVAELVWPPIPSNIDRKLKLESMVHIPAGATVRDRMLALTDFVYRNSELGRSILPDASFERADWWHAKVSGKVFPIVGTCATFANALESMAADLGIVSRNVTVATKEILQSGAGYDVHTLTEFYDPELPGWVAVDPTFNTQFVDESGHALGIQGLFDRVGSGAPWQYRLIGAPRMGRVIEEYATPYSRLFEYVWAAPARLPSGDHDPGFDPFGFSPHAPKPGSAAH
jgi:hypothetical protein